MLIAFLKPFLFSIVLKSIGEGIYTDTAKTENSERFIKLPAEVLAILEKFRAEQDSEKQRLGDKWEDYDRLFTKWNGLPMNPQTPYGWLKEFCEKN